MTLRPGAETVDAGIIGWTGVSGKLIWIEVAVVVVGTLAGLAISAAVLSFQLWLGSLLGVVVLVGGTLRAVIAARRVRSIGYVLRSDDFVFRRGVLFRRLVAVPYGRMQLIDVNRGPLARLLGLAELRLVTAAARSDVVIPGLLEATAVELRDELVERAESRRVGL